MENPGVSILKLLVAADVSVHWKVCLHLRPMPEDQASEAFPYQGASPPSGSRCTLGYDQRGLHRRTTRIIRPRCHIGSGGLLYQMSPFHTYIHHFVSSRYSQAVCPTCLETPWHTPKGSLRPRSAVHSRIHSGAVPHTRDQDSSHHCLSPTR